MRQVFLIMHSLLLLADCGGNATKDGYQQITQEEAKR